MPETVTIGVKPPLHASLDHAVVALQAELGDANLARTGAGQVGGDRNYKYLTLDKLHDAILPLLSRHELSWITMPSVRESGAPSLKYRLAHAGSKERLDGEMLLLSKADPQGQGSGITYSRRYALCAVVGAVPDEDDDGARAMPGRESSRGRAQPGATGSRLLKPNELALVAKQIKDVHGDQDLLLRAVGLESLRELTLAKWNQMKPMLVDPPGLADDGDSGEGGGGY